MENIKKLESGFRIIDLALLESNFKRSNSLNPDDDSIKKNVDINVEVGIAENKIQVTLTLQYTQIKDELTEFEAKIVMAGIFEKFGDQDIDMDTFGRINGASIIFPYVREHLSSLALKGGLGIILLPPINFTKNKKNSDQ